LAKDTNINHATSNNNAFQNRALAAVSTDGTTNNTKDGNGQIN
jgi:hypothetical protein